MKWRFFRHLLGGSDPEAERIYRWLIDSRSGMRMRAGLATDGWKKSGDDYVKAAVQLCESMKESGFAQEHAVPIDRTGELLNGSHRVACATALDIKVVPVLPENRDVWAPPWDIPWFVNCGTPNEAVEKLRADMRTMVESLASD